MKRQCFLLWKQTEELIRGELIEQTATITPTLSYELSESDWKEYLTHFTYVLGALSGYRDSLIKAESDVDLKICDILHYIELCDTTTEEVAGLVDLLKECREHRRNVKDEIIRLDAFQRNVGTSTNLANWFPISIPEKI